MKSRISINPFRETSPVYGPAQQAALNFEDAAEARKQLKQWPVYEQTPLVDALGLAQHFGLSRLWIKDEGKREPLKSFKALGGAYALGEFLRNRIADQTSELPSYSSLFEGEHASFAARQHVVATTDGNHGRSLAWGAKLFGVPCTIYIPKNVTEDRAEAIRALGAEVKQLPLNYDATLHQCAADAAKNNWIHIQDTSFEGYTQAHKLIMEGYTLMVEEIVDQLPKDEKPTHCFLQVGCGGMAACITAMLWEHWGNTMPEIILVQSDKVAPLVETFRTKIDQVDMGDHETLMIGIACGEVAELSKDLLYPFAQSAMTVSDDQAVAIMRLCATGVGGDASMIVGETGAAGFAAVKTAVEDEEIAAIIGLDSKSRVLVINSEGDTAPDVYNSIVN